MHCGFLCGTCVSSRARSECAIYCHRTNPLYCKIPQTTARTWCGDAWQGLRVVLCLEAYPVYKHRHNICHGMAVDSRMGAYTASRHGPPGGPKTRPTEWARKVNHHLGPTQWSRKASGPNSGLLSGPAKWARNPACQRGPGEASLLVAACQ